MAASYGPGAVVLKSYFRELWYCKLHKKLERFWFSKDCLFFSKSISRKIYILAIQLMANITRLSKDIGDTLAALVSPLARASLGRAVAGVGLKFNFTNADKKSARVWDIMFEDEKWIREITDLKYDNTSPPNPTLVGHGLIKLYYGSLTPVYITLLLSDWGGDSHYLKEKFFASLREHDYDGQACEVRFKNSNATLNVYDVVRGNEWIKMEDPSRLFHYRRRKLHTAMLYYQDANLKRMGPEEIGGVRGRSMKNKKYIKDICSLRLKFGDGLPVYRVIQRHNIPMRLVNIETTDERGRKWVTSWKLARAGEREWWP
jgi:hypothetical protein